MLQIRGVIIQKTVFESSDSFPGGCAIRVMDERGEYRIWATLDQLALVDALDQFDDVVVEVLATERMFSGMNGKPERGYKFRLATIAKAVKRS